MRHLQPLTRIEVSPADERALAAVLPADQWRTYRRSKDYFNLVVDDRAMLAKIPRAMLLKELELIVTGLTMTAYQSGP